MPTTIKPTVGRVVYFHPYTGDKPLEFCHGQPLAALITYVHSDIMVNLAVFDSNGGSHARTSVRLVQDGDAVGASEMYCYWMPYQKGQAAKTEALEVKARAKLSDAIHDAVGPMTSFTLMISG